MNKLIDTIIIGGGISGLSCAETLQGNKKEFILISENIGGRILMSKKGNVPYGAYFIGPCCHHVSNYIKWGRKIDIFDVKFHKKRKSYLTQSSIRYPLQVLRIIFILRKFIKHYTSMQKKCAQISQKEAIKGDKYLFKLYNQRALNFVKERGIFDIADKYLGEASYGLLFCGLDELYAFEFLRWMKFLIMPAYEFKFLKSKITKRFKKNILIDSVVSIKKNNEIYKIKTKKGVELGAKNIVVATPINISQKLLNIKKIKKPANAYMFHISGEIKDNWKSTDFSFFHEGSKVFDIGCQIDGTYLFYCDHPNPNLNKYFKKYKIIAKKFWNPAFNLNGNELLECKRDKNLYMIGDYNICGLEDSFITGIYAANQIIRK